VALVVDPGLGHASLKQSRQSAGRYREETVMANYVLTFRAPKVRVPTPEDEARWPAWFEKIGGQITDFGNRVGEVRSVCDPARPDVLGGYIVISAETIDAAVVLAEGCPILAQGGSLEVGEVIPAGVGVQAQGTGRWRGRDAAPARPGCARRSRHPVPEGVAKVLRPQGSEVTFALEERDQFVLDSDQPGQVPGVRLSHEVDLSREPFEPAGEGRLGFQQLDEPYMA
jgi:hypothetical protein